MKLMKIANEPDAIARALARVGLGPRPPPRPAPPGQRSLDFTLRPTRPPPAVTTSPCLELDDEASNRCSPALRSRTRETLYAGADTYAYARVADDGAVVVELVSRADEPRSVPIPGSALVNGRYRDALGGGTLELGAGAAIELGPRAAMVLIPEDDACAH